MGDILGPIAGGAVNTALGLALEKHNDRRQLKQAGALGLQQLGYSNQHAKYQSDLALERWKETNYAAQVEEMKKAGLSPGLMYGGSGAGGAMSAGGGGGSIGGGQAPAGGGEIMGLQLMKAQKDLLQAQAQDAKASAGLKESQTGLTGEQTNIASIQKSIMTDSYMDTLNKIKAEATKLQGESREANLSAEQKGETYWTEIKMKEAELIGLGLANEMKKEGIQLTQTQIDATMAKVQQDWKDLEIKEGKLNLDKFIHDIADSTRLTIEQAGAVVRSVIGRRIDKGTKNTTIDNSKTIHSTRNFN